MRRLGILLGALAAASLLAWISFPARHTRASRSAGRPVRTVTPFVGIHKIKHVVVIMQENRSFDSLLRHLSWRRRHPDRAASDRLRPRPGSWAVRPAVPRPVGPELGRPARASSAIADINGGKMDGFVAQAEYGRNDCVDPNKPDCGAGADRRRDGIPRRRGDPELLGLREELRAAGPHVRAGPASWSLPAHLFIVSGWSARCSQPRTAGDLHEQILAPIARPKDTDADAPDYGWTDLTYLLHRRHVCWRYYIADGTQPDCGRRRDRPAPRVRQNVETPGIWNPLP